MPIQYALMLADEVPADQMLIPPVETSLSADGLPSLTHVHTTKRGKNERSGVHAWHPYYAGYAEQFVADVLDTLAPAGARILDTWNGSGTTTFVAQRRGFDAVGVEINPVMAAHAAAKDAAFTANPHWVASELEQLIRTAQTFTGTEDSEGPLADFVAPQTRHPLLSLRDAIRTSFPDSCVFRRHSIQDTFSACPDHGAFFFSALFQTLRQVGNIGQASNPTWIAIHNRLDVFDANAVYQTFRDTARRMLQTLTATPAPATHGRVHIVVGDSRELPFPDSSFDLLITSPPYCTRIDYAVSTKPELLLLYGDQERFDTVRRSTMGAPVIVDKSLTPRDCWGGKCNAFLASVAEHASKAAASYYFPNFLQYFRDAELSLRQIGRVLRPGSYGAIVVQSSYYKEVEIALGPIYCEMAHQQGLDAQIARREVVRQHMAHINTKSRQYQDDKVYYEDVVLIRKPAGLHSMQGQT